MISFPEASAILRDHVQLLKTESCKLLQADGRTLREPILADRDFPPFDRVMMDGFALRTGDWLAGIQRYKISHVAPAGASKTQLSLEPGTCVAVMTGAPCPEGADLIIPIEEALDLTDTQVAFSEQFRIESGRYIHRMGSDARAGDPLLESGCRIGSREIGIAASCGAALVIVSSRPSIGVFSTGDELVGIEEIPLPHQIRQSNGISVGAALTRCGYPARRIGHLTDDSVAAKSAIADALAVDDFLILTGAVSMGQRDFIPDLMAELGCTQLFHGVKQRPGKPVGAWRGPRGQIILGLPGNPVSALTGLHALAIPMLGQASGITEIPVMQVRFRDGARQLPDFTHHLPVKMDPDGFAEPAATGNSGDFIGLLRSDGFVTIPPGGTSALELSAVAFTRWL